MSSTSEKEEDLFHDCFDHQLHLQEGEEVEEAEEEEERFEDTTESHEDVSQNEGLKNDPQDEEPEVEVERAMKRREEEEADLSLDQLEARRETSKELKDKGNAEFKEQLFKEAFTLYSEALDICPLVFKQERAVLFNNRAAAGHHIDDEDEKEEGEERKDGTKGDSLLFGEKKRIRKGLKKALEDCNQAILLSPSYYKPVERRATIYREMEKLEESLVDYKRMVELKDGDKTEIKRTIFELENEITLRNEKLKTEMMGKLKDLGNLVLKPFGLSTENFNLVQNQETGGYSVNFKQ